MKVRDPQVEPFSILELRPTQITVGMYEVEKKRKRWREKGSRHAADFLGKHMIPVIHGPKDRYYIIDHHHLARALHDEGIEHVAVTVVGNLSKLDYDAFWYVMDHYDWVHPFKFGHRMDYADLPRSVDKLIDDPHRSLAGELRRAGGFSKDVTPFSEFLWANFLRSRVKRKDIEKSFDRALKTATTLARSPDADYLPGWCGPVPED